MASQPQSENADGRRAERKPFKASRCIFARGNRRANVEVRDISQLRARGFRGSSWSAKTIGFYLKLASLESIEAQRGLG